MVARLFINARLDLTYTGMKPAVPTVNRKEMTL